MQYPIIAQPQSAFTPTFAQGGMADTARAVRSYGRDDDTMLVHMTPNEVNSLQGLAMAHGGSLTINPHTGLPEAGFLKSILPTLLGAGLTFFSGGALTPLMSAGIVGGGTALATGDLNKGLMAGLGAYGGAGIGGALASTGTAAGAAAGTGGAMDMGIGGSGILDAGAATSAAPTTMGTLTAGSEALTPVASSIATPGLATLAPTAAPATTPMATPGLDTLGAGLKDLTTPGGMGRFGSAFTGQVGGGLGTTAALTGLSAPLMEAAQPQYALSETTGGSSYSGPYRPSERKVQYPGQARDRRDSSEFSYFTSTNPYPGIMAAASGGAVRYQEGGAVDGAEILDRTVQMPSSAYQAGAVPEFNYNFQPVGVYTPPSASTPTPAQTTANEAVGLLDGDEGGMAFRERLNRLRSMYEPQSTAPNLSNYKYDPTTQRMVPAVTQMAQGGLAALNAFGEGGMPKGRFLQGDGDGTSDSIPATIGGTQPARLADGEFVIDARTVSEIGNGSSKAGAKKLYAMMERVHAERKKAKRGQDSNADRHLPV